MKTNRAKELITQIDKEASKPNSEKLRPLLEEIFDLGIAGNKVALHWLIKTIPLEDWPPLTEEERAFAATIGKRPVAHERPMPR